MNTDELSKKRTPTLQLSSDTALCSHHPDAKNRWNAKIDTKKQPPSCLIHRMHGEEANLSRSPQPLRLHITEVKENEELKEFSCRLSNYFSDLILPRSPSLLLDELTLTTTPIENPSLINWLSEKGYTALANKLSVHTGYPWDEFRKIRYPVLIEQLVDLYLLATHKQVDENSVKTLITFSLYLSSLTNDFNSNCTHHLVNEAKQVLGQIIYLLNRDSSGIAQLFAIQNNQEILQNINDMFLNQIKSMNERLQNHYQAHANTRLQDPELALQAKIPFEIAQALLTEIGTINIGIIPFLSDVFLSPDKYFLNHKTNLAHALKLLHYSPKLRAELKEIKAPSSDSIDSSTVIRIATEAPIADPITSYRAQLCTLMALFSHLRQGEDRGCFASSIAIEMLSSHLCFSLKDFKQLIENGKLQRFIGKTTFDIPFIMKMSDQNLKQNITFDITGRIIINGQKLGYLWEAPGLIAACHAIEISDPKAALMTIVQTLAPPNNGECHQMTIRALIDKICNEEERRAPRPDFDFCSSACFAFSSQISSPLLKIWENAIANLSEMNEEGMIKKNILNSIFAVYKDEFSKLNESLQCNAADSFLTKLLSIVQKKINLQYDPTLYQAQETYSRSITGGFVLFSEKTKIADASSFLNFLDTAVCETAEQMQKQSDQNQCTAIASIVEFLNQKINKSSFLHKLLKSYHRKNSSLTQDSSLTYKELQFTPWITFSGNDSKMILKTFLESDKLISINRFIVTNAKEAFEIIIKMCKQMSSEERKLYIQNPYKLKPLCILGKHSLAFMAGHASLIKTWQNESDRSDEVEQFFIIPAKKIANSPISESMKQSFIKEILNHSLTESLDSQTKKKLDADLQKAPLNLSIKKYRHFAFNVCNKINKQLTQKGNKLTCIIDTALCASLDPELKNAYEQTYIHFADTNWSHGVQDVHLCFAMNLGNEELEVWEINANGSNIKALDQKYWFDQQEWEFFTIQEDLAPDDSSYIRWQEGLSYIN